LGVAKKAAMPAHVSSRIHKSVPPVQQMRSSWPV
jgi:hypothetical protein